MQLWAAALLSFFIVLPGYAEARGINSAGTIGGATLSVGDHSDLLSSGIQFSRSADPAQVIRPAGLKAAAARGSNLGTHRLRYTVLYAKVVAMRALVQRVSQASVTVDGRIVGAIGRGLLVLLGIGSGDTEMQSELLSQKVVQLRVSPDSQGKMNCSLLEVGGELLVVSQFTLYGDTTKGNRPSYSEAATAEVAKPLYEYFVDNCRRRGALVSTGVFQAEMRVELTNEGPVTLMCYAES
jgi:D-tyrosyl-tRNA(Tyr) deacylase